MFDLRNVLRYSDGTMVNASEILCFSSVTTNVKNDHICEITIDETVEDDFSIILFSNGFTFSLEIEIWTLFNTRIYLDRDDIYSIENTCDLFQFVQASIFTNFV